jgi:hypothetical protein
MPARKLKQGVTRTYAEKEAGGADKLQNALDSGETEIIIENGTEFFVRKMIQAGKKVGQTNKMMLESSTHLSFQELNAIITIHGHVSLCISMCPHVSP